MLIQEINGFENIIVFASRALSYPKKDYSVTEQERLTVVWEISKFRPYLD